MGLWRGRLTLAILAVLAAGVILLPFFPLASLILWGIFLPLSGAAWCWYFPRLQKSYRLTLSPDAVTLTRGVLIRRQYLLPCPRLIYVEQFSTPLQGCWACGGSACGPPGAGSPSPPLARKTRRLSLPAWGN